VSLAVAALGRIDGAGRLPADAVLDRLGAVFADAPASTATAALVLVEHAGRGDAARASRAAVVATEAIANRSPEVQARALAAIGRLVQPPDEAVARALDDRAADVAASRRAALEELVARTGGRQAAALDQAAPRPGPRVAAARSPERARRPSPIDPARRLDPLETVEALVDVAVSVLESGEPADDVERVLDGVARLAGPPAGSERLASAIGKRAAAILGRRETVPFIGFDARADVAAVLLAWATTRLVQPATPPRVAHPGPGALLSARAREIAAAAARGRPIRSLAAPTHRGGWIDPATLVRRISASDADGPPSVVDLAAAILRLAPDGRVDALRDARPLAGEAAAAVRYALGAEEPIGQTAAWWVAAARVRSPGRDDHAVERRHPGLGPDAGLAARARVRVSDRRPSYGGYGLDVEPALPPETPVDLPTVAMYRMQFAWWATERSEPSTLRWIATVHPGDRESWSVVGALRLARNLDWWSADWANRAFLEPFLDPVTTVGPHARTLLGIALAAKEPGERGLATDVARLGIADGRLFAAGLAEGLTHAADLGCDRPNRWALSLADVAAVSPEHTLRVSESLGLAWPALQDRPPAKLVPLLRLHDELLAVTSGGVDPSARPSLEHLVASAGQAGRLARSILARGR
jgi:hypothetical protein